MKKHGDTRRAIGYVRVSTDEQANGPEAQRAELAAWAKAHGVELLAVHEDRGVSGAAPLDKRPGLLAAIDAMAADGAGLLLVGKRDRLARDVIAAAMIERLAERAGGRVVAANGAGNDSGPEGQLLRTMLDAFAQYERGLIRCRTKAALAVKRTRSERTGAVPYGMRLAADGEHLEADASEQAIIGEAVRLRTEGLSLRAVGAALESRGMLPRSGGRWHAETVAGLLRAGEA